MKGLNPAWSTKLGEERCAAGREGVEMAFEAVNSMEKAPGMQGRSLRDHSHPVLIWLLSQVTFPMSLFQRWPLPATPTCQTRQEGEARRSGGHPCAAGTHRPQTQPAVASPQKHSQNILSLVTQKKLKLIPSGANCYIFMTPVYYTLDTFVLLLPHKIPY